MALQRQRTRRWVTGAAIALGLAVLVGLLIPVDRSNAVEVTSRGSRDRK
jgi:hypothetical protein